VLATFRCVRHRFVNLSALPVFTAFSALSPAGIYQPQHHGPSPASGDRIERADLDERAQVGWSDAGSGAEVE
jgi:hypothetical protein